MAQNASSATSTAPINRVSNTPAQNAAVTLYDSDMLSYVVYLTQEKFKPNKDEGVTFYYGVITNIINNDTTNYDKRDIIHSRIDGIERVNNTTTKDNSERNLYFVHIPALYSVLFDSEQQTEENTLKPQDLYKFRIEKLNNIKTVKIGNIVKVKFENNSTFEGGIIEEVVEENILQIKKDPNTKKNVKDVYEEIAAKCVQPPLDNSSGQLRNLATTILTIKDISSIGLYDFIENFVYSYSDYVEKKLAGTEEAVKYSIVFSDQAYIKIGEFQSSNSDFNSIQSFGVGATNKYVLEFGDSPTNTLKIKVQEYNAVKIVPIDRVSGKPNTNFSKYLKYYLETNYPLEVSSEGDAIKVTLNIIGIDKESDFYDYSKKRYEAIKDFGTSPQISTITQEKAEGSQGKPLPKEQCENNIVTIDQYINTNTDNWKRKAKDENLVNYLFRKTDSLSTSQKEIKVFDGKNVLNSLDVISLDSLYPPDKLVKNNPKFYKSSNSLQEKNSLSVGVDDGGGSITIEKLKNNLFLLKEEMSVLKKNICKNENLTDRDVLIIPLKWFEQKPSGPIPKDRDKNSQLWFGRVARFVVYVKVEGQIFQIPPEIVFLYVQKTFMVGKTRTDIGVGLFTSKYQYIQYESLEGLSLKDPEPRYWGDDSDDPLQIKLKDISPNDFVSTVKDYVKTNYTQSEKIRFLTSGN